MAHFVPLKEKTAPAVARAFVQHIWRQHGLPVDIISDRDVAFTSQFWRDIMKYLGINQRMSTAFHPQTEGQTERVNQVLEAYLREYCNYEQNDWAELLPLAKFSYNNSAHSATNFSPFYANYGYHPRANWPTENTPRNPGSSLYANWISTVHEMAKNRLEKTRERMARYWDRTRREGPRMKEGDRVMLDGRHIKTKRACRKLDAKLYGPFKILRMAPNHRSAKLELPATWKIHPTFHVSLLEPYRGNPDQRNIPEVELEEDAEGWTPESIVAAGPDDNNSAHHLFLVKWEGFSHEENTWESFEHLVSIAPDLIHRYYEAHPRIKKDSRDRKRRTGRLAQAA